MDHSQCYHCQSRAQGSELRLAVTADSDIATLGDDGLVFKSSRSSLSGALVELSALAPTSSYVVVRRGRVCVFLVLCVCVCVSARVKAPLAADVSLNFAAY
jgi:hypothetical protein